MSNQMGRKERHQGAKPLDLHFDSFSAAWMFGLDFRQYLRDCWRPTENRLLYCLMRLIFPKGKHKPLFNHSDLVRMQEGGYGGACFTAHALWNNLTPWWGNPWRKIQGHHELLRTLADDPNVPIEQATTPEAYERIVREGNVAAIFSVEGLHGFAPTTRRHWDTVLARLVDFRTKLGGAVVTVNHYASNHVATSSTPIFGSAKPDRRSGPNMRSFVAKAKELGLVLDLAHTNRQGILDICEVAQA
ncbi:MAG: membrane dipeptidase, partial [Verrucomicrobiota bacterium]